MRPVPHLAAAFVFASAICAAAGISIEKRYLHIPVAHDGKPQMVQLMVGGAMVRYFDIAVAREKSETLFWSSTDLGPYKGKLLTIKTEDPAASEALAAICEQSDSIRQPPNVYREAGRPQFHFSPMVGWTNDPNGLVYFDGEYHLFFQHNPYGAKWGNMTWGHAVSPDLIHWHELGDALYPDRLGTMYSGSAVMDLKNTAEFQTGKIPTMAAFYTAAGAHAPRKTPFTQAMAYSTDRGRSWIKYEKNPVVGFIAEGNRDPKVFWHEATQKWIMVFWVTRGQFALFGSENLRDWEKLGGVPFPDGYECPELFELPVDGDTANTRWVMWEGGGRHLIGRFDGKKFTPESAVLPSEWGRNAYAAQTWNDVPDGRRILMAWMRSSEDNTPGGFPYAGMPFSQQMSIPRELTLRATPEGIRLFANPVREVAAMYEKRHRISGFEIGTGANPLAEIEGELFDIAMELEPGESRSVTLDVRGTPIVYDAAEGTLHCLGKSVAVAPAGSPIDIRILVDRTSIEMFAAEGRYVMSYCFRPPADNRSLSLSAEGGTAKAALIEVREMRSIWSGENRRE